MFLYHVSSLTRLTVYTALVTLFTWHFTPSFPALTAFEPHCLLLDRSRKTGNTWQWWLTVSFCGCSSSCVCWGRSASSYLPGYQEWSDKTSPMEAKAFSRDQTSVIWKQSYFISSFDERYPLFRDYLRNTSHLSLNAWHLPLSNCTRVLSPCIQSGPSAPQYAKLTFRKEAKLMWPWRAAVQCSFTLYPTVQWIVDCISTAIISKVRRQLLFIYNGLKSLKTQCFWYCGGRAIMQVGSVNHVSVNDFKWDLREKWHLLLETSTELK